jgi:DNA-binding FadR family transcriptional regulator
MSQLSDAAGGIPAEALFQPLQPARTWERVAEAIRGTIVRGKVSPGDTLPPERTLARRFQVTRNTVREALRYLEQRRLVRVRQGSGVTVQDYLAHTGLEFVVDLLRSAEDGAALMREVAEARVVIGRALVHHAIDTLRPESLEPVGQAVEDFAAEASRPSPDVRRLQELDFEVHSRLMRAGGNRAIVLLHNSIRHIYGHLAQLFVPLMADPRRIAGDYREIYQALLRGDRERARELFDGYFEAGREALTGS